jgi:hypothetical protein
MVSATLNGVSVDVSEDAVEEYQARGIKLKVVDKVLDSKDATTADSDGKTSSKAAKKAKDGSKK